jgi:hypothetical protein
MVGGLNPCGHDVFCTIQTGPQAHPAFSRVGTRSFLGVRVQSIVLTSYLCLLPGYKWVGAMSPLPLCACIIGISWGDLYFYPFIGSWMDPEPIWMFWRSEKSLVLCRIQSPDPLAWLLYQLSYPASIAVYYPNHNFYKQFIKQCGINIKFEL